ncbi:MAG: hypothetical protein ABW167_11235 [Baekduia sp.]
MDIALLLSVRRPGGSKHEVVQSGAHVLDAVPGKKTDCRRKWIDATKPENQSTPSVLLDRQFVEARLKEPLDRAIKRFVVFPSPR